MLFDLKFASGIDLKSEKCWASCLTRFEWPALVALDATRKALHELCFGFSGEAHASSLLSSAYSVSELYLALLRGWGGERLRPGESGWPWFICWVCQLLLTNSGLPPRPP